MKLVDKALVAMRENSRMRDYGSRRRQKYTGNVLFADVSNSCHGGNDVIRGGFGVIDDLWSRLDKAILTRRPHR